MAKIHRGNLVTEGVLYLHNSAAISTVQQMRNDSLWVVHIMTTDHVSAIM